MLNKITNIPLENLNYLWEHSKFPGYSNLKLYKSIEKNWKSAYWELHKIRSSIQENGLKYPLIVKQSHESNVFYVVVGNQRLCALKSYKDDKYLVPCIVAPETLPWNDNIKNFVDIPELTNDRE